MSSAQKTPQDFFGPAYEEELIFLDQYGMMPSLNGSVVYSDGYFYFKDSYGTYNPRITGISEDMHEKLHQLIHFIDDGPASGFISGAFKETLPSGSPFPTQETWWASSEKTLKIVELLTTYNVNKTISSEQWKMYDDGGNLVATVTDSISYSGIFEISRTRTIL